MATTDPTPLSRYRYTGVLFILLITLGVWILSTTGGLQTLEGLLYDQMIRYAPSDSSPSTKLLLLKAHVEKPDESRGGYRSHTLEPGEDGGRWSHIPEPGEGGGRWQRALELLEKLGAKQIVFAFTPEDAPVGFYQKAADLGHVLFGRTLYRSPEAPGQFQLNSWPEAARSYDIPFGLVGIPPADHGIHRKQRTHYDIEGETYPTLEILAARSFLETGYPLPETPYRVNFFGGPDRLPTVSLERLLNEGLIPDLVRGKSVLIGMIPADSVPGLHTPLGGENTKDMIPLATFQALALDTLLEDKIIRSFPTWANLLILLLIAIGSMFLYQLIGHRLAVWLTWGLILFYLLLAWLLPAYALLWPPAVEMIGVQLAVLLLILVRRTRAESQVLDRLLLETSVRLRERLIPDSFYASEDPWAQIVNLVDQTLDLNRLIFLERIPGEHKVKEIKSLNCDFEDIDERDRDYRRHPYSLAIAEDRPIALSERSFLKRQAGEDQYLTPLSYGGEILGFWVFGVDPEKAASIPRFSSVVQDFGDQIAELLYHRRQWPAKQETGLSMAPYLRLEGEEAAHQALRRSVSLLERRMEGLEAAFQELGTATILYDLFGRVVQINKGMEALIKKSRLPAYSMTALDLLTAFGSKVSISEGRRMLQHIILDRGTISISASLPGNEEYAYLLNLRPVTHNLSEEIRSEDAAPFQLRGILFELLDVTRLHNLYRLKEQLVERINYQLRNDMESLVLATDLLNDNRLPESSRLRAIDILREKMRDAVNVMEEAQQHLVAELDIRRLELYPIDPKKPLLASAAALEKKAQTHRLRFAMELPDLISLALAEPDILAEILESILDVLLDDAVENSEIDINLEERDDWIIYRFANQGFGIPGERFREYLSAPEQVTTQEFRKLRQGIRQVNDWRGELDYRSEVGEGMRFTLKLRSFI